MTVTRVFQQQNDGSNVLLESYDPDVSGGQYTSYAADGSVVEQRPFTDDELAAYPADGPPPQVPVTVDADALSATTDALTAQATALANPATTTSIAQLRALLLPAVQQLTAHVGQLAQLIAPDDPDAP